MGSRFDDCIYWLFPRITINYYSSQTNLTAELSPHSASCSTTASTFLLVSLSLMLRPTVSRSVCLTALIWDLRPDFYSCQTVARLLIWHDLCDERTGLSFTIADGLRRCSHSRVRVPWNSRPYFTVPDSRLPFQSPTMTRMAMVEVFDPFYKMPESLIEVTATMGSILLFENALCPKSCINSPATARDSKCLQFVSWRRFIRC
jgi:hypothetical protein